jgi:hypothetical protein
MVPQESPSDAESGFNAIEALKLNVPKTATPDSEDEDRRRSVEFERMYDVPLPTRNPNTSPGDFSSKLPTPLTANCDELRARIANRTIRDVSLDISPPFRPYILEKDTFDKEREEWLDERESRTWRNINGNVVIEGRLIDLAYENAIIENELGAEVEISIAKLSEPDLLYISEAWGLPQECKLPNIAFQPREWLPMTMTWKASGLCHKPLYFEEVNLERYGHTAGPFAQPVISTAHFFVNIAVLPYKMGIHPPTECQYALGYYRPGNCAPWIIPPVPLSLRGSLYQIGAVGAGIGLIP